MFDARLAIYSPVFDQQSKLWIFRYDGRVIAVDISNSGIVEDVFRRGEITIGVAYLVRLEVTEQKPEKGQYRNNCRAISFNQFLPANFVKQMQLSNLEIDMERDE